jgi:hypothetical protein
VEISGKLRAGTRNPLAGSIATAEEFIPGVTISDLHGKAVKGLDVRVGDCAVA